MTQNATHMKVVEHQGYRAGHRPHIVMINRWQERYAEYGRYLDHKRYQVSYVTTAVGLASVPPVAGATVLVDATDDLAAVRAAVRDLAVRYGAPAAVVALKEDDLLVGAELRQEWQCPGGPRPHDLLVFRDKGAMCQAIHEAGLAVPAFAEAHDADAVRDFAADHGWPVIVKPHIGSSSAGVVRLEGPADLAAVHFDAEPLLVQAYCADPIYHVDGVFDGTDVVTYRASRYLNTCLGFRSGNVLGSVEEDDPVLPLSRRCRRCGRENQRPCRGTGAQAVGNVRVRVVRSRWHARADRLAKRTLALRAKATGPTDRTRKALGKLRQAG